MSVLHRTSFSIHTLRNIRTASRRFSTPARRVADPVPILCRDNCLAVGNCSHGFRVCHLTCPGNRIHGKFVRSLLPSCIRLPTRGGAFCIISFLHSLVGNSIRDYLRHAHSFFTSVPGSLRGGARGRCRAVFCLLFQLVKRCIRSRIGDSMNHTSIIIRLRSIICIFRFGCSNAPRRTLTRVSDGRCTVPCQTSNEHIIGVNIGFSDTAQAVNK